MINHEHLGRIIDVMARCDYYRRRTMADVRRLLIPCLDRGNYVVVPDGFATWGFLTDGASRALATGARRLTAEDLGGDIPWLLQFGHTTPEARRCLVRAVKDQFNMPWAYCVREYANGTRRIGVLKNGRRRRRCGGR